MFSLKNYFFILFVLMSNFLTAQNYHAINGSSYAGSLGVGNNPASIVHVPYAWDITPFAIQFKQSTNAFRIDNYSLLSTPTNITVTGENGIKKRFVMANQDIRLLNSRINLNSKAAIAFGINIRNYMHATSSESNWQDSSYSLADYLKINIDHVPLSGASSVSAWAELYGTYAQTIFDDGYRLLNTGITLKINRALAGGYARAEDINYIPSFTGGNAGYELTRGSLQYGYSSNFDKLDSNNTSAINRKHFLQQQTISLGANIGFEYIILTDEDKSEGGDYAYDTKIGVSVIDIGRNKYVHGSRSRLAYAGLPGITDTLLENRFSTIKNFDNFNDSLESISNTFIQVSGDFYIYHPTRLIINVDRHLVHNFFINAALTLPIVSLVSKNILYLKDLNLLAITPRWELQSLGAYMPVLLNNRNQLWVGGAIKAGPLLLGTHNLLNLFSKNKIQTGGLYLAFTIRPGKLYDRQAHYPKSKLSKKGRQTLQCPQF